MSIAIVGIQAELPGGTYTDHNLNYHEFGEFLRNKGESYGEIPAERFDISAWHGSGLGQTRVSGGAFLKDIGTMDHLEFGISASDAKAMAVSTRKLIELAFLSLLDSGIDYRGRNVGCYAAGTAFDILSTVEPDEYEARGSFAGIPCMIANKVSYHLDLRGPSVSLDTACSSSLTATHLAVQALRAGECEAAVVCACQLNTRLVDFIQYSQGSVLAPDGKCKPFDARADGFSRGEGAIAIVIKPLSAAVENRDHIYGTILGTGINSSGLLAPVYAPVALSQMDAMHRAYQGLEKRPEDVDFIEMHATGTAVGDPAECSWVREAFKREDAIIAGSVKGNIGHLEITAFLASLCKVCLLFESGILPATANLETRNPAIDWGDFKLEVPTKSIKLDPRSTDGKYLVSINSSGIGGSNGHVVLESYPSTSEDGEQGLHGTPPVLLMAGGLSPKSCAITATMLGELANCKRDQLLALSTIFGRRARQLTWRTFRIFNSASAECLSPEFPPPILSPRVKAPLVFVFAGQGPQHIDMGRQLFQTFPIFRDTIRTLDRHFWWTTGTSMIEDYGLFDNISSPSPSRSGVWPIAITLPALVMVQIALFDLLGSFGIRPDILVGHSAGETALLYASGAAPKEIALEVAIARARALGDTEHLQGSMAALRCTAAQACAIIDDVLSTCGEYPEGQEGVLEIACFNGHEAVTISGHENLVKCAVDAATKAGYFARQLRTRVAVHSSLIDSCQDRLESGILEVFAPDSWPRSPKVTTYSTCTGGFCEAFTVEYFWRNTRNPVLFSQTIGNVLRDHPSATFVEISPHPQLSTYIQEMGAQASSVLCPMRREKIPTESGEHVAILAALGRLAVLGFSVDFNELNGIIRTGHNINIPPYPFSKKFVPYLPRYSRVLQKQFGTRLGPLNFPALRLNANTHPELAQHIINQEPIMAAAGFLEMVFEAGARTLWNVNFVNILSLAAEDPIPVDLRIDGHQWSVESQRSVAPSSKVEVTTDHKHTHVNGFMSTDPCLPHAVTNINEVIQRCQLLDTSSENFYADLQYFAQYGPYFRRVRRVYVGNNEAVVEVRGNSGDLPRSGQYIIHPAVLDACFHVLVHVSYTLDADPNAYYLPSHLESIELFDGDRAHHAFESLCVHATMIRWLPDSIVSDLNIMTPDGKWICSLNRFTVQRHLLVPVKGVSSRYGVIHQSFGIPSPIDFSTLRTTEQATFFNRSNETCGLQPSANVNSRAPCDPQVEPLHRDLNLVHYEHCLTRLCLAVVNHATEICGKRVIRALVIDDEHEFLLRSLSRIKNRSISLQVFYSTAAATPPTDALPPSFRPISDRNLAELVGKGLGRSLGFDLVAFNPFSRAHLHHSQIEKLYTLLLPGGALVLMQDASTSIQESSSPVDPPYSRFPPNTRSVILRCSLKERLLEVVLSQMPCLSLSRIDRVRPHQMRILRYSLFFDIDIQDALRNLDINRTAELWIITFMGSDSDGARGLIKSLRCEFPLWDITQITFMQAGPEEEQVRVVQQLSGIAGIEPELVVTAGLEVLVPRIVELPGPSSIAYSMYSPATACLPSPDHVEISVLISKPFAGGLHGVIGCVMNAECPEEKDPGASLVATVAYIEDANAAATRVVVHKTAIYQLGCNNVNLELLCEVLPACLIAGSILGSRYLSAGASDFPYRVILEGAELDRGKMMFQAFTMCGVSPHRLLSTASPVDVLKLRLTADDVLISHRPKEDSILSTVAPGPARYIYWNQPHDARRCILYEPQLVSEILRFSVDNVATIEWETAGPILTRPSLNSYPQPAIPDMLFKPDEVYVLLGGVGSLGLHISVWMYDRGARHLVLTSRSGRDSLRQAGDKLATRMLHYLESRPDLTLTLHATDASSKDALLDVFSGISHRIAGCMLLAAVLSDASFFDQTEAKFTACHVPKIHAFRALEQCLPLQELDFVIAFSSVSTFGNIGQTNYASANTALEGEMRKYANAFAIVAPAIIDTASITGKKLSSSRHVDHFKHLIPWAFTARELCDYIEDGLHKLKDGPFDVYIPNFDWDQVQHHMGFSHLYGHLVRERRSLAKSVEGDPVNALCRIVSRCLGLDVAELLPGVPLTSYGLDSLSAGQLSVALRPYVTVSSIQLLGESTLADLEGKLSRGPLSTLEYETGEDEQWTLETIQRGDRVLVKFVDKDDPPFILLHGGWGEIDVFIPFVRMFTTAFWALRVSSGAPFNSIDTISRWYYNEIKAHQPRGPYRLGGYSGTSIILFAIVKLLETNGDDVVQLIVLDHFPLLFVTDKMIINDESIQRRSATPHVVRRILNDLIPMYDQASYFSEAVEDYKMAVNDGPASLSMQRCIGTFKQIITIAYEFLFDLFPSEQPFCPSVARDLLIAWLKPVRAPVTLVIASEGIILSVDGAERALWRNNDLGVRQVFPRATVLDLPGNHWTIFESQELVDCIETGWRRETRQVVRY
ncbi:putative polyketide synthase [Chiua virens]|nr:putative polyketide synthase [Chiua virens]